MISLISRRIALFALLFVLSIGATKAQVTAALGNATNASAVGGSFEDCFARLELTADQRSAIGAMKEEFAAFNRTTMQQIEELSRSLREAREAGNREEVSRLEHAIGEKKQSLASAQERLNNAIVGKLTTEQQAKLRACMTGEPGNGGGGEGGGGGTGEKHSLEDCLRTLHLTDAQAAEIARLREAAAASARETNQQLEELGRAINAAREAGNREEVSRLEREIATKKASLASANERLNNAIIALLTPEQQAALRLCMTGEGGTGGGGEGGGGNGGGGNGGGGTGGGTVGGSFEDCLSKLELTAEQRSQIGSLKEAAAAATREINQAIEELNRALRAAREAGNRDEVARIENAIAGKKADLKAIGERLNAAILALLTREQQARLNDCMGHKDGGGNDGGGDKGRGDGDRKPSPKKDCLENILTDAQKEQIRTMIADFKEANSALMQELRGLYADLRTARREHNADAVASLRAAIAAKLATLKEAQTAFRDAVLALLTPEQLEALNDCREDHDNGRGGKGPGRIMPDAPSIK